MCHTYIKSKTLESFAKYKTYRNNLTSVLRAVEKLYYTSKLVAVKDNLMNTWKIINHIINRSKWTNISDAIIDNSRDITDKHIIANKFNSYFANIGSNLASKIKPVKSNNCDYLTGNFSNSMFLTTVTEIEIFDIINSLKNSTSKGHDNITTNVVKECKY